MRAENSAKNIFTGIAGRIISMVLAFVVRTVFIKLLGEEYLGINGLLSSVFTVLNLAELGFGSAILYAMYKPAAEDDREQIKSLLRFFRNTYRIVGGVFLGLGLLLLPFLDYLVKGSSGDVNLRIIYVLYLLETTSSYWFFVYATSVVNADQKGYALAGISYLSSLGTTLARIAVLFLLRATPVLCFYVYAALGVITTVLSNVLMYGKTVRMYPWILEKDVRPLPSEEKTAIKKNVVGLATNKVCMVLNDGIDSTIVSAFIGLAQEGIFSNYLMLRQYISQFISTVFGALTASVGNLCAVETTEKKEEFFQSLQLTYFWVYGFCAICFWTLYDSFIVGVWLRDTKWLLTDFEVFLLCFNFLIEGIAGALVKYRDTNGLFWKTKYRYIASSVLNVLLSIVLTGPLHMGVAGALLGTTVSLTVMLGFDPVLVYREVFRKKAGGYYKMYFGYLALALATGAAVHILMLPFRAYTFGNFLVRMLACILVPNGLWYLLFRKDVRFLYLKGMILGLAKKICRRLTGGNGTKGL